MLKGFQATHPWIQSYRGSQPFDPMNQFIGLSEGEIRLEMGPKLFRMNVNFMDGVYSGQFSKNPLLPHGYGIFIQNKSGAFYEGWRQGGLRSGHGRLIQDNGLIYEGQWSDNRPHGLGDVTYPQLSAQTKCDVFSGTFKMSKRNNWGTLFEQSK